MNYWDSVGRWINTLLLFIVGVIGFDTLFRMLQAQESNVIVSVVRVLSTIVLIPFRGMFSEQDYLLTAAMGVLGYAVLVGIALTVLRALQATRTPRRSDTVPLQHQPAPRPGGYESGASQRARPQRTAPQRPASQGPGDREGSQPTGSARRASGQRKPAQRVDGQRKPASRVDVQRTAPQRVDTGRAAPERADTEPASTQRPPAASPDAQTPEPRRPASRPKATPRPQSESGNHNGRMAKPQADKDAARAPNADEVEATATTPAGARAHEPARGASGPKSDKRSRGGSDNA